MFPIGICYGLQLLALFYGGKIDGTKRGEYGRTKMKINKYKSLLYANDDQEMQTVWMSHSDEVTEIPDGFEAVAHSEEVVFNYFFKNIKCFQGVIVAIEDKEKKIFGIQYHPEVTHTERGMQFFRRFLFDICHLDANWSMQSILEQQISYIQNKELSYFIKFILNTDN